MIVVWPVGPKALREAIAERLTDHGFAVEQADNGEHALQRLADFAGHVAHIAQIQAAIAVAGCTYTDN